MTNTLINQSTCCDVIMHGINRMNPIEPKIGQEFTINGRTYACQYVPMRKEGFTSCSDCDMPGDQCLYMQCCRTHRLDNKDVIFKILK